jgi:hypothetical protein
LRGFARLSRGKSFAIATATLTLKMQSQVGVAVAIFEADLTFKRAVVLELGPALAAGLLHLVVAVPAELDGVAVDGAGEAIEGELAASWSNRM